MGEIGFLTILIALFIGAVIWKGATSLIRVISTPPAEMDPDDVVQIDQDYRCTVCGAELTMRAVNLREDNPPKHCREEMVPVWRPA
jgi:hypothetical protein